MRNPFRRSPAAVSALPLLPPPCGPARGRSPATIRRGRLKAQMVREGADPVGGSPQQFAQFVQKEYEKWRTIVHDSGATAN